jgi:hypothetical protein
MIPDLSNMDEVRCPDCGKPLVITDLPGNRSRFEGCGRDCRDLYILPDGCISVGPVNGLQFIYQPRLAA